LFALIVDGIKIAIEAFSSYQTKDFDFDPSKVSVIIPCYNKRKEIAKCLISVRKIFPKENVFVVDDGSTDNSLEVTKSSAPGINIVRVSHQGKVRAIDTVLQYVNTPFVLLLDADVVLPENFRCPTSLLEKSTTAAAFNVVPVGISLKRKNLVLDFQSYEYAKSMQIGRKFQHRTASVHCISGAAGLFITARLKELTQKHTKIFQGEDLERTLIELVADGKVIFIDQIVETQTPNTWKDLLKQRVTAWWPGLWRNIPLFFKVGLKKHIPVQLRIEMVYQLFSLFTDPLKILSLLIILLTRNWFVLGLLYFFYLLIEVIVYGRMKNGYLRRPLLIIILYFFYNLLQIILRIGGLGVFLWKWGIKKEWRDKYISLHALKIYVPKHVRETYIPRHALDKT